MFTLKTPRTILRPLTKADCAAVQRWASLPENVTHMPWGPNSEEDTLEFLQACEKKWAHAPIIEYELGIVLHETGELVGSCGIYLSDDLRTAVIGWILRRDYWNRGIMTEVAHALIRFCFEELHLHRITADCNAPNHGSYRVMERNNMRREGHYIKSRRLRNVEPEVWVDVYNYAILEEEYFNA